ncbi:MAG: PKD domain-containing protein, partial [Bacteroidota bacterium]
MRYFYLILFALSTFLSNAQDVSMQPGQFNRCQPDRLFDSGGEFGNYGSNEDIVTTICAIDPGDFVQLNFTAFSTQLNIDILEIYDGDDLTAPFIGSYSGAAGPGTVQGTSASGCLTVRFITNDSGVTTGFAADIVCATPCQTITAAIDSTNPPVNASNEIEIDPGQIVEFFGSATFSGDGTGAIYEWDFDDGSATETGEDVSHQFATFGTYNVTLTVTDNNPLGCSDTISVTVVVRDNDECLGALPICSGIENVPSPTGSGTAEAGINYGCLVSQPNPRWYFLQTGDTAGSLNFTLSQTSQPNGGGTGNDVDFIIWGPFDEPVCDSSDLNSTTQVDCSYSAASVEDINIPSAPPNSLYILLITNFSQDSGFINLDLDSSSTADTECDIICQADLGDDQDLCTGEELVLSPDFNGSFSDFEWLKDGVVIPDETGPTLTVTEGGTYTIIADGLDAVFGDPCQAQDEIEITIIGADPSFTVEPNCIGATSTITGDIGGLFSFNPVPVDGAMIDSGTGEVTNGISGTTYSIEYTVSGSCSASSTQDFVVEDLDDTSFTLDSTCDGATATVTGTPGGTFSFSPDPLDGAIIDPSTGIVTNGVEGTVYTIQYATSGICGTSSTQDFSIIPADDPSFSLTPNCTGATATISGSTGGTFTFNPDLADGAVIDSSTGTITNGVPSTTYTVEYTTSGTCVQTSQETVTILPASDASFEYTPSCVGAVANILGDTGGNFIFNPVPTDGANIDNTTGEITNGVPGVTYTVEYSVGVDCPDTESVDVTILDNDEATFTLSPTCDGATAIISGTPGGTFSFSPDPLDGAVIDPSTGTVTSGIEGTVYTVQYATLGPCPDSSTQTFSIIPADNPAFSLTPGCEIATATILGDTGGTFALNPDLADGAVIDAATGTINNAVPSTTYTVEYTTAGPCVQTSQESVTIFPSDDASFGYTPNCTGATATILGDPGGTFEFNFGSGADPVGMATIDAVTGEIADATPGFSYAVDYTTSGSCPETETVLVTILDEDDSNFILTPTCDGAIANIVGLTGGTFVFNPLPTDGAVIDANTGLITNGDFESTYTVEYTTNGDCPTTTSQTVTVLPQPVAVTPTPLEVCDDGTPDGITLIDLGLKDAEITGGNPLYSVSYHLSEADALSDVSPLSVPYENQSNGQTVFARVVDSGTGCVIVVPLVLQVQQAPVANA